MVIHQFDFWMYLLTYLALEIAHTGFGLALPVFDFSGLTISSGLLTFFIVYYNLQAYSRFAKLWEWVVIVDGNIKEFTKSARILMADKPTEMWAAVRYIMASMVSTFNFLDHEFGTEGTGSITTEHWEEMM